MSVDQVYDERLSARETSLAVGYRLQHNPVDDKIYCLKGNQTRKLVRNAWQILNKDFLMFSWIKTGRDSSFRTEASMRRKSECQCRLEYSL